MNDIEAKKQVYQDYVNQIYRFCMFKLNNKEDAEDMTSEVFTKFITQDINKITNVRAWLYATARNAIYDKRVRNSTENLTVANIQRAWDEENLEFKEHVDSYIHIILKMILKNKS